VAVHEDHGASGGAPLDRRPGLAAAVDAVRDHEAGVLLVARRDRLARDTMIAAVVGRLVERNGGRVLTADGVAGEATPEAKLMRTMIDAFAEYERMLVKMRTKAALAVKRGRGERVGKIPYGFRLADDGVHLVEDPAEQRTIARLAKLRESMSLREVAEHCRANGIRARDGEWWPRTIRRVLACCGTSRSMAVLQ
jgi:DNA invertase Pin-like site-specific DNA recombinase